MKNIAKVRSALKYLVLAAVLFIAASLTWLRWESGLPRDDWFRDRQGQIETAVAEQTVSQNGQLSESVTLESDSGLQVSFRVIREVREGAPLPVLLVLGGHRTGSDSVDLFGEVNQRAIVGVDYPYDGPDKVKGLIPTLGIIPKARQAILDIVPSVSLILDWLVGQDWADKNRIIIVGASLGVPFAATAAARDERITGVMLVHGAADTRLWLEVQVARRIDTGFLHYPVSTVLYWLAYGSVFDTGTLVADISPRPVLIVGARDDERTPEGQAEVLFDGAREPKRLRFTEGRHIQPNRNTIITELLSIAEEELPFLTQ
jgi:fermentation-respiration switch protein FrsA (DUF1100 family)